MQLYLNFPTICIVVHVALFKLRNYLYCCFEAREQDGGFHAAESGAWNFGEVVQHYYHEVPKDRRGLAEMQDYL
jgi:hypothetical protein